MSSHAAALHGTCPVPCMCSFPLRGFVSDVCPMSCLCAGIGAAASVFFVCLLRILIMQLCRCDSFGASQGRSERKSHYH